MGPTVPSRQKARAVGRTTPRHVTPQPIWLPPRSSVMPYSPTVQWLKYPPRKITRCSRALLLVCVYCRAYLACGRRWQSIHEHENTPLASALVLTHACADFHESEGAVLVSVVTSDSHLLILKNGPVTASVHIIGCGCAHSPGNLVLFAAQWEC